MAIDTSGGGVRGRRPSNKAVAYTRVVRGQEIQQLWPKKRGSNLHPKTKAQMEYFRQVQWAFKYSAALIQISFAQAVARSPLLPRDLFLMAASGRMHFFITPGGHRMVSTAAQRSISDSFDILGQLPGQMLVRGPEIWQPIEGGTAGQVLTSVGAGDPPEWQDVPIPPPGVAWGDITGTLADQLDLNGVLTGAAQTAVWGGISGLISAQADLQAEFAAGSAATAVAATEAVWGSISGAIAGQADLAASQAAQDVNIAAAAITAHWGSITGSMAAQSDLTAAIAALVASIATKANLAGGNAFTGNQAVTGDLSVSGTIAMGGYPFFGATSGPATTYEVGAAIPRIAQFTVQNPGTGATFVDTTYGCKLVRTAAAGAQESFAQFLTAPGASAFVLSARIVPADATWGAGISALLTLRNSTSGRLIHFGAYDGGRQMVVQNMNSFSSFNSNVFGPWGVDIGQFPWRRVTRAGNALAFYASCDGDQWELVIATTVNGFLTQTGGTLDQVGFGQYSQGAALCQNFNLQNISPPGYTPQPWYSNGGA